MKPYESYKSTNIPWIKEIPHHWGLIRNKNVLTEQKDVVGNKSSDYDLLSLTLKGVILRDMENAKGKFPKDFDTYKIVKKDNIIFCLFDVDETPRTVGLSSYNGMITGAYDVFSVSGISNGYLYYYYLSIDNVKAMKPLYTGLRKVIGVPTFLSTKLPLPPRTEQDQIVRFLDWQLSKINKLINAKKRQIELLKEQKQAIINKAVTKGLDENVPMKDSGVEWLGEIPQEWEIKRLRQILSPISIKNRPDLPLLSVVRERGVIIRDIEDKESNHNFIPDDLSGYKVLRAGQFAMNKMKAWQGSYGISEYEGIVSPAYFIFDVQFNNLNYFHYAIRSKVYINFFAQASDGIRVGQWDLSLQKMKEIPFITPPENEQRAIVEYIPIAISKIEKALLKLDTEINLLHEYRTRLISDVVTGKVDVRDAVVPDFEAVEEVNEETEEIDEVLGTEEE